MAYYDFRKEKFPSNFTRKFGNWNNVSCNPTSATSVVNVEEYNYSSLPIPVKGLSYSSVQGEAIFNAIVCGTSL